MAHWIDVEELARVITGVGDDAESDEVEGALYDQYEISFESFHKLIDKLAVMTPVARTALTDRPFTGFVHDGAFIVKEEAIS